MATQRARIDAWNAEADALNQKDLDSSIALATRAREEARSIGYGHGEAYALDRLGFFMDRKADYRAGIRYYRESMAVKAANQDSSICWTLSEIGYCLNALGLPDSARIVYRQAMEMARRFDRPPDVAINHIRLSVVALDQSDMNGAVASLREALAIGQEQENWFILGDAHGNLSRLYLRMDEPEKARHHALGTRRAGLMGGDDRQVASGQMQLGLIHSRQGRMDSASFHYRRAIRTAKRINDVPRIAYGLYRYAQVLLSMDSSATAEPLLREALAVARSGGLLAAQAEPLLALGNMALQEKRMARAKTLALEADGVGVQLGSPSLLQRSRALLSDIEAALGHPAQAFAYLQSSIEQERKAKDEAFAQNLLRYDMEQSFRLRQLSDSLAFARQRAETEWALERERANAARQRIALASSGLVLLLLGGLAFAIHRGKRSSDRLLLNILPRTTAKELKANGRVRARLHDQVTILFTDFVGFTALAAEWSVGELVDEIDACFRRFDAIVEAHGLEKIKTIGDAYMAVGGLDGHGRKGAARAIRAALDMQDWIERRHAEREARGKRGFRMRVGLHSGSVAAGVVGTHKFQYDVWGDAVNVAARVESSGEAGCVHASSATRALAGDAFAWTGHRTVDAKGKGTLETAFVCRDGEADNPVFAGRPSAEGLPRS